MSRKILKVMSQMVTLLTDFGSKDSYVAEMKGILLSHFPSLSLVDISHDVGSYDVEEAAFQLWRAARWFPHSACHLAIVDPGVGSSRKPIFIRTGHGTFIGPDNGVLLWAVEEAVKRKGKPAIAYEIPSAEGLLPTFHGRDLFCPFLINFLKGRKQRMKRIEGNLNGRSLPQPKRVTKGSQSQVLGEVLSIDKFGNVVTNLSLDIIRQPSLQIGRRRMEVASNYLAIPSGQVAFIAGSHGFWEVSMNCQSAAHFLKLKKRDPICVNS